MREFAKISPQLWINQEGRKIKKLGLEAQLISLYLLTCPHANMLGIYYLPITFISHETGISAEIVTASLQNLHEIDFCSYDLHSEYVWVHNMAFEQVGLKLNSEDKRVKGIKEAYLALPSLPFLISFYEKYREPFHLHIDESIQAPSMPLLSKEKENEKHNEKEKKKITDSFFREQAIEILNFLNEKAGKDFQDVEFNTNFIVERLRSGATADQCRQIIIRKVNKWKGDPLMDDCLRPKTLFQEGNFHQYRGELVVNEDNQNESN